MARIHVATCVVLVPTVWYNTAQLLVQTLNAIPERAFV